MVSQPRRLTVVGRIALAVAAGLLVGTYTALELLPNQMPLQVTKVVADCLKSLFESWTVWCREFQSMGVQNPLSLVPILGIRLISSCADGAIVCRRCNE